MIRLASLLAFLAWTGPALALCQGADFRDRLSEADRAAVAAAVAATPFATGLRWVATRGDDRIDVIGTMHIHDPRHAALLAAMTPAVAAADLLLVEAGDAEEAAMEAALLADPDLIFITDGPTLPELVDEDTWAAIVEATRARQIPPFLAAKMEPWYLSLTLSIPPCIIDEVMSGREGLDGLLMDLAAAEGVEIRALEPWTTLFDIMRKDDLEAQLTDLRLSLLAPELQSEMFVSLLSAYFSGDVAEIWEVSRVAARYVPGLAPEEGARIFAETQAELLDGRNRAWIDVIEAAATEADRIVLAVGAAHLPGEAGVLNLLAQSGWSIAPAD